MDYHPRSSGSSCIEGLFVRLFGISFSGQSGSSSSIGRDTFGGSGGRNNHNGNNSGGSGNSTQTLLSNPLFKQLDPETVSSSKSKDSKIYKHSLGVFSEVFSDSNSAIRILKIINECDRVIFDQKTSMVSLAPSSVLETPSHIRGHRRPSPPATEQRDVNLEAYWPSVPTHAVVAGGRGCVPVPGPSTLSAVPLS